MLLKNIHNDNNKEYYLFSSIDKAKLILRKGIQGRKCLIYAPL